MCVVGATGVTGRRVARAAADAGLPVVLAGRNWAALDGLAADLGAGGRSGGADAVAVRLIDVDRPDTLAAAVDGAAVVVSCVGPFTRFGFPMAEAAVRAGVHYVDTSGEPVFCLRLVDGLDAAARRRGVAVVPAVGGSAVPGDVAAACALGGAPEGGDALTLAYRIRGMRPSRGTLLSEIEIVAGGAVVVDSGVLRRVPAGGPPRLLPGGWGTRMPVPDPVVVSRYCPLPSIEAFLVTPAARVVGRAMRCSERLAGWALLRAALRRLAALLPETGDGRAHGTFSVAATVWGPWGAHTAAAGASDVYGFTARAAALVAGRLAADHDGAAVAGGGVRAASQVLTGAGDGAVPDPAALAGAAGDLGLTLSSAVTEVR
jgi:short subunit dehydrogenase-like uncharacterized protein